MGYFIGFLCCARRRNVWKRVVPMILMLVLIMGLLAGCSRHYSARAGECIWCDGVGYSTYKDATGNYVRKICSHCGGSGRS